MLPFIGHNDGRAELAWLTGSGLGEVRVSLCPGYC